jgi:hypothetical protein
MFPFVPQTTVSSHPPYTTASLHLSTTSAQTSAYIDEFTQLLDFSSFYITVEFIKTTKALSNQTSSPLHLSTRHEVSVATQAQGGKVPLKLAAPSNQSKV